MPRDANGNASLPPGYLAVTGQTVQASQHNPPLEDLASMMTGSLARNGSGGMQNALYMGGFTIFGLGTSADDNAAATVFQVALAMPIGAVTDFAGGAAPSGYLLCSGQEVNRTTYAKLFNVIGTAYGAGNGTTTFNVPDLRGRIVAGMDNMGGGDAGRLSSFYGAVARTLGGVLGVASHILTIAQIPSHTHAAGGLGTSTTGAHVHTYQIDGGAPGTPAPQGGFRTPGAANTSSAGDHSHTVTGSTASAGSDNAHPNAQPTMMMNKIIKAL